MRLRKSVLAGVIACLSFAVAVPNGHAQWAVIDVANPELLLKPGMTATANIIVAERPDVLVVANNARGGIRINPK